MDKRVVIHVGMSKAASTYLQHAVFPYMKNVYFVRRGPKDPIGALLLKMKVFNPVLLDSEEEKKVIDRFLDTVSEESIVISDEWLFGTAWENFYNNYSTTDFLKKIFPQAKILLVIRRQVEWCESIYNQVIKAGFSLKADTFFSFHDNAFHDAVIPYSVRVNVKQLNLYKYMMSYCRHFGKESVLVLPYELFKKDNIAFLDRLYDYFQLQPFYPEKGRPINRSISSLSLRTGLVLNRLLVRSFNTCGFLKERPFSDFLNSYAVSAKISEDIKSAWNERRFLLVFIRFLKNPQRRHVLFKLLNFISMRCHLQFFMENVLDYLSNKKYRYFDEVKCNLVMEHHREDNKKLAEHIRCDLSEYGYY